MFLIGWLDGSGHRLSTGSPNSSGLLRVLSPGTQTEVPVFDAGGETLTQPIALNAAGRATVYVDGPVDLSFEDSTGAAVQTMPYGNVHGADGVLVESAAFNGTRLDGSQGAGGRTYLDSVLMTALASFGGLDFQYRESTSAVSMPVGTWMTGVQLNVKGYGAKGDGLNVDTSAIQLAINRCSALGGGRVYFPPGTYLTDLALSVPAKVSLIGAGSAVSVIKGTAAAQNGITVSAAGTGNNIIQGLGITHSSTSSGIGLSILSTNSVRAQDVAVAATYAIAAKSDASSQISLYDCSLACVSNAANRCYIASTSGTDHLLIACRFTAVLGTCLEWATATSGLTMVACAFVSGAVGIKMTSSSNDDFAAIVGCRGLDANMGTAVTATAPAGRALKFVGCFIATNTVSLTSGQTVTPEPCLLGPYWQVTGTTTGSAYIVASPTNLPFVMGEELTIRFFNSAGGAVTGWTLNAIYHVSAAIPTTDNVKTTVTFYWDGAAYHEKSRSSF